MKVTLISAVARGNVIGTGNGGIPWSMPRDVEHFRSYTAGKALLLGRVTYQEMLGWFSDHFPIVLSRSSALQVERGALVGSVPAAIELASPRGELVVCGGGEIYAAAMPYATDVILTQIDADIAGSVYFPEMEPKEWASVSSEAFPADDSHAHAMTIQHLSRKR
ncbi:MAG: dihydrofolate reductase [Verrucomicrobiota bacterium]